MFFIHPMWDHEAERIGKRRCTPIGYVIHVIADYVGFLGLLMIFAVLYCLIHAWIYGTFKNSLFWLLLLPFGFGLISELLYRFSWALAYWKGFRFDYGRGEASWIEAGERRTYTYK
jgi:hypothetical protein